MKKLVTVAFASVVFVLAGNAQPPVTTEKAPMSKEEKMKMKMKQEEELNAAFKEAGLTADQEKQVRAALDDAKQKSSAVKKDDTVKDEEKAAKIKEINDQKNAKLKELMGDDKYRLFNAAKKKQKEAAMAEGKN
ncbi:MAG: hypothetical protein ABIX01_10260 [Chitinophagaceae bacterium]